MYSGALRAEWTQRSAIPRVRIRTGAPVHHPGEARAGFREDGNHLPQVRGLRRIRRTLELLARQHDRAFQDVVAGLRNPRPQGGRDVRKVFGRPRRHVAPYDAEQELFIRSLPNGGEPFGGRFEIGGAHRSTSSYKPVPKYRFGNRMARTAGSQGWTTYHGTGSTLSSAAANSDLRSAPYEGGYDHRPAGEGCRRERRDDPLLSAARASRRAAQARRRAPALPLVRGGAHRIHSPPATPRLLARRGGQPPALPRWQELA